MPLRARVDGREVIAPLLGEAEWAALREDAAAGRRRVVLPCCQTRGHLRTSRQGTRHFYHRTAAGCAWAFESFQHLHAKAAIALGCRNAGYDVRTECAGAGWRADVLAARGAAKVAFEVQWSEQSLAETEERQRRYGRVGIRACWFFRRAPDGLRTARRDLPLFELVPGAADTGGSFAVSPRYRAFRDAMPVPLADFVQALLSKRVRFCSTVRALPEQQARVVFYPLHCRRCGSWSHIYYVDRPYRSSCGNALMSYSDVNYVLRPEIVAAVRAYLATEAGRRLRPATTRRRHGGLDGRPWLAFSCPSCNTAFTAWPCRRRGVALPAAGSDLDVVLFETSVVLPEPAVAARPHWCYPPDGAFCEC